MSDGNGAKPAETPIDVILDVEDREDDIAEPLTEAATGGPEAPWSPVPMWVGRRMRQERPETGCEFIFPTVFEENRSEKIADLGAARQENWITHRRAAEQGVKELGFDAYDYDEEQNAIAMEKKAGVGVPQLGQGDALARSLGAPDGSPGPPVTRRRATPGEPMRADLANPAVADFKRDMRAAEAVIESLRAELTRLRAARPDEGIHG